MSEMILAFGIAQWLQNLKFILTAQYTQELRKSLVFEWQHVQSQELGTLDSGKEIVSACSLMNFTKSSTFGVIEKKTT